jgi:hypothetical protein
MACSRARGPVGTTTSRLAGVSFKGEVMSKQQQLELIATLRQGQLDLGADVARTRRQSTTPAPPTRDCSHRALTLARSLSPASRPVGAGCGHTHRAAKRRITAAQQRVLDVALCRPDTARRDHSRESGNRSDPHA